MEPIAVTIITGLPASGKTTLGTRLQAGGKGTHLLVDQHRYSDDKWTKAPIADVFASVNAAITREASSLLVDTTYRDGNDPELVRARLVGSLLGGVRPHVPTSSTAAVAVVPDEVRVDAMYIVLPHSDMTMPEPGALAGLADEAAAQMATAFGREENIVEAYIQIGVVLGIVLGASYHGGTAALAAHIGHILTRSRRRAAGAAPSGTCPETPETVTRLVRKSITEFNANIEALYQIEAEARAAGHNVVMGTYDFISAHLGLDPSLGCLSLA